MDLKKIGICKKLVPFLIRKGNFFRLINFVKFNQDFNMCLGKNCTKVQRFFKVYNLADVHCSCGHGYCLGCKFQKHHPCSCVIALKWIEKESSERENIQWIIAKTKKCSRCRIPIEKN